MEESRRPGAKRERAILAVGLLPVVVTFLLTLGQRCWFLEFTLARFEHQLTRNEWVVSEGKKRLRGKT